MIAVRNTGYIGRVYVGHCHGLTVVLMRVTGAAPLQNRVYPNAQLRCWLSTGTVAHRADGGLLTNASVGSWLGPTAGVVQKPTRWYLTNSDPTYVGCDHRTRSHTLRRTDRFKSTSRSTTGTRSPSISITSACQQASRMATFCVAASDLDKHLVSNDK